ncbi:DNA mismatch repair protein MutS2 [Peptoniphilus asaccharolyticus DSM 20463]|uniref:Endonuclease MutS2 n=1 Tax=Peptoniphilus asaccharolyticus DSM 20463 TaxID=573058 RepID=A0A1W1UB21_PEPAS|nr:endonuclease MutS2 [Peptoniphilus asaccharolyticus]MBL7575571.1 endonuclease MutS2 [Peptoniphilus asaccharolyticus]SMB78232.1 DNA mismatch repair protein MutS2 [Peptoniphilus asaccharolyticus DSM 20463]
MDEPILKSYRVLEFDKMIEKLKSMMSSELAIEYADEIKISLDKIEVVQRLKETTEAVDYIIKRGEPPLFGIYDMSSYMKRLEIGGYLTAGQLIKVGDFLRVSRYLKNYLAPDESDLQSEILVNYSEGLMAFKKIEDTISDAIISENEISDSASQKLASIRRQISKKKDSIRERLSSMISSGSEYLQDAIVTIREGRYVIPVKNEHKSKVKGIVHDMSSSKQTVYIEPLAVVNINNELRGLELEEREEIERILQEISSRVDDVRHEILLNQVLLRDIDFIFAKGKLSLDYDGRKPIINDLGYVNLKSARHPLLDKKKVVPIDINLGKDFTSLIITGPNTGGKTVSIKTLGLLTLMAQYGLHIPATEDSEIAIFDKVLADIGDEQSIEQSLSTFSSHMINIVEILKDITPKSLVIFDELGAGTDPTEGAALARSIMDFMLRRKIRCISTTHYNQLKLYALSTEGVQNATMEFNVDTLSPTYKLLIGVPGKSNAFEISKKLGLPDIIIRDAKKMISDENIEFEEVLSSIEKDRTRIEEYKQAAEAESLEYKKKNDQLKKEIEKLNQEREKVLEKAREEANRLVLSTRENMELVVNELSELREQMSSAQARKLQEAQDLYRESFKSAQKKSEFVLEKAEEIIGELKVGETVRATSLNSEGIVLELPDSKNQVLVQMGMLKMKLPLETLVRTNAEKEVQKTKTRKIIDNKSKYIKTEIDIRGNNFEDARVIIDKYIDDAYLSGIKEIRIIHGKGTGVLREKIRNYLRKNKYVKHYEDAPANQGGYGATVVEFKN